METEPKLIEQYIATGKVKLIYRHLVQIGNESERTAEASECAADQGKFWEMRYTLYERQGDIYGSQNLDATLAEFAAGLQLDTNRFNDCLASGTYRDEVQADYAAATRAGVRSRPVFEVGQQRLIGAQSLERFQQLIDAALPK